MAETISSRYIFSNTANLANQHVNFKSGTQAELNKYLLNSSDFDKRGKAAEGTFYLTTDTHRLYIGRKIAQAGNTVYSAGSEPIIPVPINEGIQYVDTLSDLEALANNANAGEFYYVGGTANILAIYNGQQWVQINPDTNTNDTIKVTGVSIISNTANSNSATLVYDLTLTQEKTDIDGATTSLTAVTASFSIDRAAITGDVSVGFESTSANENQVTLQLTGDNTAASHAVPIRTTSGISLSTETVTSNNATVTGLVLSGLTYGLSATGISTSQVQVKLTDDNGAFTTVSINTGTALSVTSSNLTDSVLIEHKSSGVTSGTYGSTAAAVVSFSDSITIPKITIDERGHVTSATDIALTLPSINSITATNDGNLTLRDQEGQEISSTTSILYYTITIDDNSTASTINNQGYLGSFYSKQGVDNLIEDRFKTFNAMTYKGTVGSSNSTIQGSSLVSTTQISVGDTFMVDQNGYITVPTTDFSTSSSISCNIGDLLIAQGTEATNSAYIVSGLTWARVPAGSIDTTYTFTAQSAAANNQATLRLGASTGANQDINIYGTTYITTHVITGQDNSLNGIRIDHGLATTSTGTFGPDGNATAINLGWSSTSNTFAIPKVTVDQYGHITAATKVTYTLPSLNNYTIQNTTNSGVVDIVLHEEISGIDTSVTFNAGNILSVTSSSEGITYSHNSITTTAYTVSTSATLSSETAVNLVTGITTDSYGHITSYSQTPVTVHSYALGLDSGTLVLKQEDGANLQYFSFTSSNSTISITPSTVTGTDNEYMYDFELVWQTF